MQLLGTVQFMTGVLIVSGAVVSPSTQDTDLASVVAQVQALQNTILELTTNLTSANQQLQNYDAQVKSLQSHVNDINGKLSFTKVYNARVLAQIGNSVPIISFQAHLEKDPPAFKDRDILKFSHVRDNRGGGYNYSTGVFTAPISGCYLVWCNIMNNNPLSPLSIYLNRGNTPIAYAASPPYVYQGAASMTTVTFLGKGQEIYFRKFKGSETLKGADWSSYGGTLIRSA